MLIKEMHFLNYCQHRDLTVKFKPGLNAIVGPIGSGKSNILKGIRFVFTGASGNAGKKDADITYSMASNPSRGSVSSVTLVGQHKEDSFSLCRYLSSSKRILQWGNEPAVTADKEVTEFLRERLGVDPLLFDEFVIVNQGKLAAILNLDPADRLIAMQKLSGMSKFSKVHTWLGQYVTQLPAVEVLDSEEVIADSIKKIRVQLESTQQAVVEITQEDVDIYNNAKKLLSDHAQLTKFNADLHQAIVARDNNTRTLEAAKAEVAIVSATMAAHEQRYAALNQKMQLITQMQMKVTAKKNWQATKQYIAQLEANLSLPAVPPGVYPQENLKSPPEVEAAKQELAVLEHLKQLSSKLVANTGKQVCPTCMQEVSSTIFNDLSKIETLRAYIQGEASKLTQSISFWQMYEASKVTVNNNQKLLGQYREMLATYPADIETYPDVSSEVLNTEEEFFVKSFQQSTALQNNSLKAKTAQVTTCEAMAESLQKKVIDLQSQVQSASFTQAEVQAASTKVIQYENAVTNNNKYLGSIAVLEKQLESENARMADFKVKMEKVLKSRKFRADIISARDVFHQDNLPAHLSKESLKAIAIRMNEVLEGFSANYRVTPKDDGAFSATFFDNSFKGIQSDERLSGGESAQFGLALQVASQSIWAQELGFFGMDEPTYGFGPDDMKCVGIALEYLKKLSVEQGIQVIIITHEKSLLPLFDNVISLE